MTVTDRDLGFRALRIRVARTALKSVTVGIHEETGSEQYDPDAPLTIAEIASFHEFGTEGGVPERSFLRETVDQNRPEIWRTMRILGHKILRNTQRMEPDVALQILGLKIQALIQQRIRDGIDPPLSDERLRQKTIDGKEGFIPLIHTGQLIQSITFEVHGV